MGPQRWQYVRSRSCLIWQLALLGNGKRHFQLPGILHLLNEFNQFLLRFLAQLMDLPEVRQPEYRENVLIAEHLLAGSGDVDKT